MMLLLSGVQHVLLFCHLVVVSALIPKGVVGRSALSSLSSNTSKYYNSTTALSSLTFSPSSTVSTSHLSASAKSSSTSLVAVSTTSTPKGSFTSSKTSVSSKSSSSAALSIQEAIATSNNNTNSNVESKSKSTSSTKEACISSTSSNKKISATSSKVSTDKSSSKTSSSHSPLITSLSKNETSSKKTTSTSHKGSITSAAHLNVTVWDGQTITEKSCASSTLGLSYANYCRVLVGTISLHYWPTGTAALNKTYPSTMYLEEYDITMTSPSVYFAINTMKATGLCGQQVGPTLKNFATGYHLSDVYTLQPYADKTATTRMGEPQQLQLSDLRTDCPKTTILPADVFDYTETNHLVLGKGSECNPILSWPTDLKHAAGQWWASCGRHWGGELGLFDPPVPVTACTGDASACLYGSSEISSVAATTTKPISASVTTALQDQGTTTPASPSPTIITGPSSTKANAEPVTSAPLINSSPALASSTESAAKSVGSSNLIASISRTEGSNPGISTTSQSKAQISGQTTSLPDNQPGTVSSAANSAPQNTSPTVVAAVGSNTFSAVPGSTGIILPNGSTASAGEVTTVLDASSSAVVVSVGSSNLFVGSESYVIPTSSPTTSVQAQVTTPIAIATISGSSVISATPGATELIVGSQTASVGGAAVTDGENVIKLTPSGVEVGNTNDDTTSTYTIPTASQSSSLVNVALVDGQSISVSAAADSSAAIVDGKTLSAGGAPATLSGGNVVSLGSSGVVVQASAGSITTITIPSTTPDAANIGIVNGQTISVAAGTSDGAGSSIAVVAGQTLTAGGPVATLSGGEIASLGSSGVVVQASGGTLTTISIPAQATAAKLSSAINVGTFGGQTVSIEAVEGSSVAVIGSQTLTAGGSVATLSGGNVASLGASGIIIQQPSGKVTTIPISRTSAASETATSVNEKKPITSSSDSTVSATPSTGAAIMSILNTSKGRRSDIFAPTWFCGLVFGWGGLLVI